MFLGLFFSRFPWLDISSTLNLQEKENMNLIGPELSPSVEAGLSSVCLSGPSTFLILSRLQLLSNQHAVLGTGFLHIAWAPVLSTSQHLALLPWLEPSYSSEHPGPGLGTAGQAAPSSGGTGTDSATHSWGLAHRSSQPCLSP